MLRCFLQSLICLGLNMKVSCTQIYVVLHLLSSELDSFFCQTPTCLVISRVVYSLSWCSRSIQILWWWVVRVSSQVHCPRNCPDWSVPTRNTRFNNRRLCASEPSNPSVPMSFAVHLDLRGLWVWWSPSSSDKHTKVVTMDCHPYIFIRIVEQCCAVFASSESSQFFTNQGRVVKLPGVRSVLNSIHALDQSASFVFAKLYRSSAGRRIFIYIYISKSWVCMGGSL